MAVITGSGGYWGVAVSLHEGVTMDKKVQDSQEMLTNEKTVETGRKKVKFVKNVPLLIAEIGILLIAIGVMYVVVMTTTEVDRKAIDIENITINDEVAENLNEKEESTTLGYRNIALFGVDSREGELGKGTRSDSMIIASINQDTQEIKLISVFRDTYLNLSNDTYNNFLFATKANFKIRCQFAQKNC